MNIYNAVINGKKDKNKEVVLFHGTNFIAIQKTMNTRFNRDYDQRGQYGKGTWFGNRANIATEYDKEALVKVERGDNADYNHIYGMIACRANIGENNKRKR